MHRIPPKMNFFRAHVLPRDKGSNTQCLSPDIPRAGGRVKKHPATLAKFGLLILPPHFQCVSASTLQPESNVELGHISWRRKRWNTSGKKGWAGGCQDLWQKWMESHVMQSHLCLQHTCTLRAWHLMDISSNATWQSLYSWNIAQNLTFLLARKQSSERIIILMARAGID